MADGDEFDPSAAAARAVGDLADGDDVGAGAGGDAPDPAPDPAPEGDADGGSSDTTDAGSTDSDGLLATIVLPLFLADERGPTASTFERHDVDGGIALILDGMTDFVLDLAGKDVGDSLGPAGKIGLGWSRLTGEASSTTSTDGARDDADDDREAEAEAGEDLTGGAEIDVEGV